MTCRYPTTFVSGLAVLTVIVACCIPAMDGRPTLGEMLEVNRNSSSLSQRFPLSFSTCVQACTRNLTSMVVISNLQTCHHECMLNPHKYDALSSSSTADSQQSSD